MPQTEMRLIRRCAEYRPLRDIARIPHGRRGIYVLLNHRKILNKYDVVYVGLARTNVKRRLSAHARSRKKEGLWTHFSFFEVFDNVRDEEIVELEGILRHLFRRDTKATSLNLQKSYRKLVRVRDNNLELWD